METPGSMSIAIYHEYYHHTYNQGTKAAVGENDFSAQGISTFNFLELKTQTMREIIIGSKYVER